MLGAASAALLVAAVAVGLRPASLPGTSGSLRHEAYVWQRNWTIHVQKAIDQAVPPLDGLVCLGAEVRIRNGQPRAVRVSPDYRALAAKKVPIGVALRIGPYRGPFSEEGGLADFLADQASSLIAEARAEGLEPSEIQIDFDCTEADLDGYCLWLRAIRRKAPSLPVIVTALPCWLKRAAFARLAAEAGGYVLQVHSLERPKGPDEPAQLCDAAAARRAVERAGRIGVPFRVALPTYGYVLAFGRGGRFLGLSAEGPMAAWGPAVRLCELRADPAAMAALVQGWTENRPACMSGIVWYRLPVGSDALNWRWPTLSAVIVGRAPVAALRAELRRPEPGLVEVDLVNCGEADGALPAAVPVSWAGGELLAADAVGGFELGVGAPGSVRFTAQRGVPGGQLPPGARRMIGWLRFGADPEVQVRVAQ